MAGVPQDVLDIWGSIYKPPTLGALVPSTLNRRRKPGTAGSPVENGECLRANRDLLPRLKRLNPRTRQKDDLVFGVAS